MIFFGHLGLTAGAIKTYEKIAHKGELSVDYRIVLLGSILPDIIDKPIGAFLFRSTFHNSRIFAHTLLFSALLIILGLYFVHKNGTHSIFLLGVCSSIHLILDSMWLYPSILFWPFLGLKFPERPEGNWLLSGFVRLISDPGYFLPELIGFIMITYYFIRLLKNKQLIEFIKNGKL